MSLRLPDDQVLTAELPNEELESVQIGARVWVDLRHAKAFETSGARRSPWGRRRPGERAGGHERLVDPADRHSRRPAPPRSSGPDVGISLDELDVLLRVADLLRRLEFGSVLIVVQDGKVVQIEMAEKIRLR